MTFRTTTPEISLLKNLRYNHYIDIGSFQGGAGFISDSSAVLQPFVEAFLTTKERFNFEIEVMTVQRGEDGKPSDLVPTKQVIQATGLGLPNIVNSNFSSGSPNNDTTKTLKFVDFKVNTIGFFSNSYDDYYGEYWSDDVTPASNPAIIPFERTVIIPVVKMINKLPVNATGSGGGGVFVFTDDYWSYDGSGYTPVYNNYWNNTMSGQVLDIACYIP